MTAVQVRSNPIGDKSLAPTSLWQVTQTGTRRSPSLLAQSAGFAESWYLVYGPTWHEPQVSGILAPFTGLPGFPLLSTSR